MGSGRDRGLGLTLGGMLGLLVAAPCPALSTTTPISGPGYVCQAAPTTAAALEKLPDPPVSVAEHMTATPATDGLTPPCPEGQVPYPTATPGTYTDYRPEKSLPSDGGVATPPPAGGAHAAREKRRRTSKRRRGRAHIARELKYGSYYSHAGAQQRPPKGNVRPVWHEQPKQDPAVYSHEKPGSHSLSQLWAVEEPNGESNKDSTVEEGWTEAPLSPYNDVSPHLFVAISDCGVYPGSGGYVGIPGSTVPWV